MNRNTLGQILASLRKEMIEPETDKVWTQSKLAEVAGLSIRMDSHLFTLFKIDEQAQLLRTLEHLYLPVFAISFTTWCISLLPDFDRLWQEPIYPTADISSRLHIFDYDHTVHQHVQCLVTTSTILTPDADLYLFVLAPSDRHAASVFMHLSEDYSQHGFEWS